MKKIDKTKLKELGKKIGIFIAVIMVFVSWFLMGVRYGRKHPKTDNITANADISPTQANYNSNKYIPLTLSGILLYTYDSTSSYPFWLSSVTPVFPSTYLIIRDGFNGWSIGQYGTDITSYTYHTYDLEQESLISCNIAQTGYTNVQFQIAYEVTYVSDNIDWSSISDYYISKVLIKYNYFTDTYMTIFQSYQKQIIEYYIYFGIGEDQESEYVKISCYPYYLTYKSGSSTNTPDTLIWYCNNRNSRTINVPLPYNNYALGLYDGYANGYQNGANETYVTAYNTGYEDGFRDGSSDGNSIRDVVKTAIETPVNMFKTILNWNFLGYNLFGIFSAIITILLVVFIIKKLL